MPEQKLFSVKREIKITKDYVLPHKKALVFEYSGCNLKCVECNSMSINDCVKFGPEWIVFNKYADFSIWILENMKKYHIYNIILTGGEPFDKDVTDNYNATINAVSFLFNHSLMKKHHGSIYIMTGYDKVYTDSFVENIRNISYDYNNLCHILNLSIERGELLNNESVYPPLFIKCGRYMEKYRPYINFKGTKHIPPFKIFIRNNRFFNKRILPSTNQTLVLYHMYPKLDRELSNGGIYDVRKNKKFCKENGY